MQSGRNHTQFETTWTTHLWNDFPCTQSWVLMGWISLGLSMRCRQEWKLPTNLIFNSHCRKEVAFNKPKSTSAASDSTHEIPSGKDFSMWLSEKPHRHGLRGFWWDCASNLNGRSLKSITTHAENRLWPVGLNSWNWIKASFGMNLRPSAASGSTTQCDVCTLCAPKKSRPLPCCAFVRPTS